MNHHMKQFKIGIQKLSPYEFNNNDRIKLKVIKKYNLNVNKRGENKYTLQFLCNINSQICNKSIKIIDNSHQTIENCIIQLEKEFNIVKDTIELTALEVSQMLEKELSYFSYIPPNEILYEPITLPIDPYYIGFWLGDGHSAVPGMFTCGGEAVNGGCNDQEYILPFMKQFAKNLNLKLNPVKKTISFAINQGNDSKNRINSKNECFKEDWLEDAIKSCKKLEISKKTLSPYHNFRSNYDPCKEYLKYDNYYCNHCSYNTSKIEKRKRCTIHKSRQYGMRNHLKYKHNIILPNGTEEWNKLTVEEKRKWKKCDDSKDICKNSKYFNEKSGATIARIYKIYENNGVEGLKKYQQEKINKCNPLNYWFRKLNLINNKHIPEIYLKSSVEDRKKLLAGIIDSDGTSGGKSKKNIGWGIIQKRKIIIDGIEKLAKSLGMFTRRTTKQCRAKKKDGSYSKYTTCYRMSITPYHNWNLPILLQRKQITCKPHNENVGCSYLRIKKISTNIIQHNQWTEEIKIILYSVVDRFKKLRPLTSIPWSKLNEYDKRLKNISHIELETIYNKTLKKKLKYDNLIIPLEFNITIDSTFMNNYNKIKDILTKNETFNNKTYTYLYNWFNNWKFNKEYKDELKKNIIMELDEIRKNNIILIFKLFLDDTEKYILKESKPPTQKSQIGHKLNQIRCNYEKRKGDVWNNNKMKKLWEDFKTKYNEILSKNNRSLTFILIDNELNEKKFNTQSEVCKFLKSNKGTIKKYRNIDKYFKGYLIKTI